MYLQGQQKDKNDIMTFLIRQKYPYKFKKLGDTLSKLKVWGDIVNYVVV
jgi:hypothetical protein